MKKNAMLKIAAILLVAVLLTTCAISSTFAKYSSDFTGSSETARVAKWGVTAATLTAKTSGDTLFLKSYDDNTAGAYVTTTTDNLIAPGTSESVTYTASVTETGTEVSYAVKYVPTVTLTGFDTYCPLVFTVNGGSDITGATGSALKTALEAEIADAEGDQDLVIAWSWAYDDDTNPGANDVNDTALGTATTAPSITLAIGLNVYQTGPAVE